MWSGFFSLLKKDFRLMLSGRFFLLMTGSLILYSCYINLVYVGLDQDIYPVYLYDPLSVHNMASSELIKADSPEELQEKSGDGYAVGIDASGAAPEISMISSGISSTDQYRAAYAMSLLSPTNHATAEIIGTDNKEMKSRREITCEFLFF